MTDLAPMSLREAIECAKILVPHVAALRQSENGLDLVDAVLHTVGKDPVDVLRILAYMEHRPIEAVALDYQTQGAEAMLRGLSEGMRVNPLPDLIEASFVLGLTNERWVNGAS
jgi:hypothetical protein